MSAGPNRLANLFAELKRRRVVRVAFAYAVAAYAVVQATSTFFPPLHVPDWVLTVITAAAVLGFIPAIALAWAFDWTSQGVRRTAPAGAELAPRIPLGRSRALWLALGGLLVLSGAWYAAAREPRGPPVDANVVAVLPFRVSSANASMSYLREGMLDLLAAKLTGEGVPRAVDPRSLLSAWRRATGSADDLPVDEAREFARRLGAGLLLIGEAVGTPTRLTLSASLLQVGDGGLQARSTVEGPPDSLSALVDRLAGELLAERAGEGSDRTASLTSTSLPALQAYLAGQQAIRRGEFQAAIGAFERALAADSTFALAGLGLELAYNWTGGDVDSPTNDMLVWRLRPRLSHRDQLLLDATIGPKFPAQYSGQDLIDAGARAVAAVPDRPEAWVAWGDWLFHFADLVQAPDGHAQSRAAFRRALELDSSYAAPW